MQNLLSSSLLSNTLKIKIYISIILSVLYGCETWSPTLWEERRLRVFENRALRRVIGPKRDEVTGNGEKNEVGVACGAHGGGERCAQGSSGEIRGKEAIGGTQT